MLPYKYKRSAHQNGFEKKKYKRRCHPLNPPRALTPGSPIARVYCQSWDRSSACLRCFTSSSGGAVKRAEARCSLCLRKMTPVALSPCQSFHPQDVLLFAWHRIAALANVREMRERKKRGKSLRDYRMKRALRCVVSHTWSLVASLLRKETAGLLQLFGIRFCRRTMLSACDLCGFGVKCMVLVENETTAKICRSGNRFFVQIRQYVVSTRRCFIGSTSKYHFKRYHRTERRIVRNNLKPWTHLGV